jgi:hypothetical protein
MWPQQAQPPEDEISILPDQPAQPNPDIDELAAQMKNLVVGKQLVMIPAMPLQNNDSGFIVFLGQEDMSASEFRDVAVTAGAKLFYAQANAFDAERDLKVGRRRALAWQSSEEDPGLASLREEASVYNGRIGEIALGFAADGVLHCWIVTAPWYDRLVERLDGLEPTVNPMFEQMPEAEARALTDRLAQELIQMPEFRSAPTGAQRRRLARAQTEIAALEADTRPGYRHVAFQAIRQAEESLAAEADSRYREVEAKLADLAVECEATPTFRNARSSRARREHARDFLVEKAGGYPPPTRLLELFLDTPPLQKVSTGRH